MVTGPDVKRARGRLHLTQKQLADMLGVSRRTVAEWEATAVLSPTIIGRLSGVVAEGEPASDAPPLASVSDLELVSEMGRRLSSLRNQLAEQRGEPAAQPDESPETGHQVDDRHISSPHNDAYPTDAGAPGSVGTELPDDGVNDAPRFTDRPGNHAG